MINPVKKPPEIGALQPEWLATLYFSTDIIYEYVKTVAHTTHSPSTGRTSRFSQEKPPVRTKRMLGLLQASYYNRFFFFFYNCARSQSWETIVGHMLPINNANTGKIAHAVKHLKTCAGNFLTYIYLFITGCSVSILALYTIKIISISLWLIPYIALHATLTARDFFLAFFYPSGPFTCIFSKTSPDFSCDGGG